MDVNELRIAVTVLSFIAFIGIVMWVGSRRNAARFVEAEQLPFLDEVDAVAADRSNEHRVHP